MITLHHLNNSRSQRIIWLLEELGVDYKIQFHQRDAVTSLAPQSLKDVHPLGKSPVITDAATGRTLAESGVIIEYLLANYGKQFRFVEGDEQYWDYLYWLHFSEGTVMPSMVMRLVFTKMKTAPMPFFIKPIARMLADKVMDGFVTPNILSQLKFIEAHLAKNTWFCGDKLSGADFQMSFPLEASAANGMIGDAYPAIQKYVKTFQALPAYQAGLAKGGDYDFA